MATGNDRHSRHIIIIILGGSMTTTTARKPLRTAVTCLLAVGIAMSTMAAKQRPLEEICDWDAEAGQEFCFFDQQPLEDAPYQALPQLTGTQEVGSTLSAVLPESRVSFDVLTYQWLRNGSAIPGATSATFKLTDADIGKTMGLTVYGEAYPYEDAGDTFTAETPVKGHLLTAGTPVSTGTKRVGSVLTVNPGTWSQGTKISYRWLRNGVVIPGAATSSYKLTQADLAKRISIKVTGMKPLFTPVTRHIVGAAAVAPSGTSLANRTLPAITGTPTVGSALKATPGTWSQTGTTFKYQWLRHRAIPIQGATGSSYEVTAADIEHKNLSVKVYAAKPGWIGASAVSASTGRVVR
ncbi:hypothetical protein [Pseudarthrobacter sp. H2]|uniref:hypothetical protein n=1 Tax=Pseudarthrobacter sp. H2 TaxID=3418415 RepID=UPI003CE6880D